MFDWDWESLYISSRINHEKETACSQLALIKNINELKSIWMGWVNSPPLHFAYVLCSNFYP